MSSPSLAVSIARQMLELRASGKLIASYPVSTAAAGAGELEGSLQTPRGAHTIRAKIGAGAVSGAVFAARRPTGEIWNDALQALHPDRDWILTRILWLSGCEPGRNRLGEVDTMRRYIYIHGTPYEADLGKPASCGCIRMANADVIELFDQVASGTRVCISED